MLKSEVAAAEQNLRRVCDSQEARPPRQWTSRSRREIVQTYRLHQSRVAGERDRLVRENLQLSLGPFVVAGFARTGRTYRGYGQVRRPTVQGLC